MRAFSRNNFSIRHFSASPTKLPLEETLRKAGCSDEEIVGWSKELSDWPDHSVRSFVEKLAHLNGARPTEPVYKVEDLNNEDGVYVNEFTGEEGGYKGPEPTRFGDWEHKGRCTDF